MMQSTIPETRPKRKWGELITIVIVMLASLAGTIAVHIATQESYEAQLAVIRDFHSLSSDELSPGLIIKGKIDSAYDLFAEEYDTVDGVATGSTRAQYYLIPISSSPDGNPFEVDYFIVYKAASKQIKTMDQIVEQTWSDSPGSAALNVPGGIISSLPNDIWKYLNMHIHTSDLYNGGSLLDFCSDYEITGTDDPKIIRSRFMSYMIEDSDKISGSSILTYMLGGLFIMSFIVFIVILITGRSGNRSS